MADAQLPDKTTDVKDVLLRTDDTLHWENWQMLRGLLVRSDFLYVADSKLCVSQILMNIDRNQGRFITVVPRTRREIEAEKYAMRLLRGDFDSLKDVADETHRAIEALRLSRP